MKYNKTLALVPALLLAACGGSEQTMNEKVSPGSVVYSYPADGQADVSPKADIVLRFSHAVTGEDADLRNKILLESKGQPVPFSINRIDGGKSLKLSPSSKLEDLGAYTVTFREPLVAEDGRQISTPNAVGDTGIQFKTRGIFSVPAGIANSAEEFGIAWQVPANNSPFEAMNFSTFRLAMTHPVHPEWEALGGSIQLLDGSGESVPATVLVKGNRITVDPCLVEDPRECGSKDDVLDTGQTYTLQLDKLASLTSAQADLFSQEITFTPRETGPTVVLQQSAVDSGLAAGSAEDDVTRSVLNGQLINGVTLNSVLQGEAGPSQQSGDLFAELAFAPAFEADSVLDAEMLRELDSSAPSLVSWMPGPDNAIPDTRQSMQRPGAPVILFFDEPLSPDSVAAGVSLFADGVPVESIKTRLDGTAVILNPNDGLCHSVDYEVVIDGLTDLAGNPATTPPLQFSLDDIGEGSVTRRPALALTTYPGYPCETDHNLLDLSAGVLGQCYSDGGVGDTLPVSTMPSDRPITVVFSKSMDLNSIISGDTFIVEKVTQEPNGSVTVLDSNVAGRLEKNLQRIRFYPDQPWEAGAHYRYTLKSSEDAGTCTVGAYTSICDSDGRALKTDLLEGLDDGGGNNGPDHMVIYFTGTEPLDSVFTPLRNLPVRDTNANFLVDCDSNINPDCLEPFVHEGSDNDGWAASANSTKLRVRNNQASASPPVIVASTADARVGCETGERCPKDKFIYQTYALNTEVVGPGVYEPTGDEGILVNLYPTQLATTSISVFTELRVFGFIPLQEESITNTQILRMRYAKDDPACSGPGCSRAGLIPGVITEGANGQPVFKTRAELMLDAPDMEIPLGGRHDLYGRQFVLELEGNITFFDDGRMQIEQRNANLVDINVRARALGVPGGEIVTIDLPLQIPEQGVYLNFISNPVKELPAEQ